MPGVEELFDADSARWRELFAADGLHPDRILVVQYAAEGLAMATGYDELARTEDPWTAPATARTKRRA